MILKCKNYSIPYTALQWNWNFAEVYNFTDHKVNWREKLDGLLVIHLDDTRFPDGVEINLGDYIVKDFEGIIGIYSEDEFNKIFEEIEDDEFKELYKELYNMMR